MRRRLNSTRPGSDICRRPRRSAGIAAAIQTSGARQRTRRHHESQPREPQPLTSDQPPHGGRPVSNLPASKRQSEQRNQRPQRVARRSGKAMLPSQSRDPQVAVRRGFRSASAGSPSRSSQDRSPTHPQRSERAWRCATDPRRVTPAGPPPRSRGWPTYRVRSEHPKGPLWLQ